MCWRREHSYRKHSVVMGNDEGSGTIRPRVAFVAVAVALMTASFVLVKTGRDALYFQARGLFDLPKAYIGIALLSVPFAFGTLRLMKRRHDGDGRPTSGRADSYFLLKRY